ncbi:uncharacterized protein Triagg1_8557 [Trichoderma aggressivum f. europaeum]|uniref:BZIP domain-containing protein n=1 Tax=Trichoderma aggressivum f. europaeum TaxID=173218 RepID=A0AAE1LX46_9HYPO|nr:hypothetical protein Triagg1_8557 [Trichoderma aggressivum f. europaeum]
MSSAGKRSLRLPSSPIQGQAKRRRGAASNPLAASFNSASGEASSSPSQAGINVQASTAFDPATAYHNLPQMSLQAPTSIVSAASQTQSTRSRPSPSLRMGSCSLDEMLLSIPPGLASAEHTRRKDALQHEISFQERNPPILPPSQVQDLPPKPFIADFLKFPDGISDPERLQIETRNNEIAAEHQKIDRQRNNQAAKKSRQARLEALSNTRVLLNEKTAECAWFRMKVLALGGSTADWGMVPAGVKTRLVKEIDGRVKVVEGEVADAKKREEAKKRADRNKRRAEARKDDEGEQGEQHLESSE